MKTKEQVEFELNCLIEYCKRSPAQNGNPAWLEGRVYSLLWLLGVPPDQAILQSHDLTNPVKAVCPPPTV